MVLKSFQDRVLCSLHMYLQFIDTCSVDMGQEPSLDTGDEYENTHALIPSSKLATHVLAGIGHATDPECPFCDLSCRLANELTLKRQGGSPEQCFSYFTTSMSL